MGVQTKILVILGLNNPINIDETAINEKIKQIRARVSSLEDKEKIILLQKSITFLDLTSLNSNDTQETIQTLCLKAMKPIEADQQKTTEKLHTAAVCVYSERAQDAIDVLEDHDTRFISVASAGDFPSGKKPFEERLQEVNDVVKLGVDEIDIVIDRSLVLTHDWDELFNQLSQMKDICDNKNIMKTILSVGDLPSLNHIYKVSMVAMAAGTNFIKTSTGKETVNATLPAGIAMCQAIKEYKKITGRMVGLKPAGGIKTATQALEWVMLIKEELGDDWLTKEFFRIGASSLLDDIANTIYDLSK